MATVMDIKVKTWSPAVPCKVSDNIVSSQFSSQKVFIPSYEKEKRPCIEQLLTNEYQRIWWQEKEEWDKRYTGPTKKTATKLLQRKIIKKKPTTTPIEKTAAYVVKPKTLKKPKKKKETTAVRTDEKEKYDLEQEKEQIQPKDEKCSE